VTGAASLLLLSSTYRLYTEASDATASQDLYLKLIKENIYTVWDTIHALVDNWAPQVVRTSCGDAKQGWITSDSGSAVRCDIVQIETEDSKE
jgi:hypothetical protein